jgi:ankyrin repeat protein
MLRVAVMIGAARAWRSSPLDDPLRPDLAYSVEGSEPMTSTFVSDAIKSCNEHESLPGQGIFHLAVIQGYVDAVRDLLRLGAIPAAVHEDGTTPLHRAAEYGRARIVEMLVQDGGADVDVLSAKNETALCVAVAIEHVRTTKAFLRLGANPNVVCHSSVTMKTNYETVSGHRDGSGHEGHPPLFYAGKIITDDLLRHGADVDARDTTPNYKGYTALLHAAARGELDVVRSLLDAGADIDAKCDVRGNVPLYGAVVNNHPRVVEVLLAHGAEVSPVNGDGFTPLAAAAAYGHVKVAKALVRAGADPWSTPVLGRKSPVEYATEKGHSDVVAAMTRADKAANPRHSSSEKNREPVDAAVVDNIVLSEGSILLIIVLVILGISWIRPRMLQWHRARQRVRAERELLDENTAQEPRRRNRGAQARESEPRARPEPESTTGGRPRRRRRHRPQAPATTPAVAVAAPPTARAPTPPPAADGNAEVSVVQQERLDREATVRAREDARRDRDAAAEAAREAQEREIAAMEREAAAKAARAARDREAAADAVARAREQERRDREAGAPEEKSEESPAAPRGYEILARVLHQHGEVEEVLPKFLNQGVDDAAIADLVAEEAMDPPYLMSLGMSRTAAEAILAAISESAAAIAPPRGKVLVDDDILDDAAARQEALETSLTARQAEVARLKEILKQQHREIPDAYVCPITVEVMEDPCIAADGNSYERREIQAWFARGKRTSPMTGAQLPHTHLTPNINLKKAIQAFLEEVRQFDCEL